MQIMKEEIQPIKNVSGFFPNVISQPLTYGVVVAGKERGGNAVGIDDGPLTGELRTGSVKNILIIHSDSFDSGLGPC